MPDGTRAAPPAIEAIVWHRDAPAPSALHPSRRTADVWAPIHARAAARCDGGPFTDRVRQPPVPAQAHGGGHAKRAVARLARDVGCTLTAPAMHLRADAGRGERATPASAAALRAFTASRGATRCGPRLGPPAHGAHTFGADARRTASQRRSMGGGACLTM
jgi:hypothetical protein